ncbi:MAG TPA: hypothetical protein VI893_04945 [Thermoplasmata archaeon]|nr:hypothetical protein [Thermoplasmata archaeon]
MTELTLSARIPKEMEVELEELMRREHLEKSAAMRKLLHLGLEAYRRDVALRLLAEGKATISRAAEIAKVSLWEIMAMAKERRIVWVSDDLLEDIPVRPASRRR